MKIFVAADSWDLGDAPEFEIIGTYNTKEKAYNAILNRYNDDLSNNVFSEDKDYEITKTDNSFSVYKIISGTWIDYWIEEHDLDE